MTTATVRMPISLAPLRPPPAPRPVPVPPPMPAVMNTMCAPASASRDLLARLQRRRAPRLGLGARAQSGRAELDLALRAARAPAPARRCSWRRTPRRCTPLRIMWSTALPPAPPTPTTLMTVPLSCVLHDFKHPVASFKLLRTAQTTKPDGSIRNRPALVPHPSSLAFPLHGHYPRAAPKSGVASEIPLEPVPHPRQHLLERRRPGAPWRPRSLCDLPSSSRPIAVA